MKRSEVEAKLVRIKNDVVSAVESAPFISFAVE